MNYAHLFSPDCRFLSLDVDTVSRYLSISEENRRVSMAYKPHYYPGHSERFDSVKQVLCREALSERCYWEVSLKGSPCAVAVAYKDIRRSSTESQFGYNDVSWSLECYRDTFIFRHSLVKKNISGPRAPVIGVFLDYKAGTLAFYSISGSMTLLHREQTTFSQPLYPGFGLKEESVYTTCSAELINLWQ